MPSDIELVYSDPDRTFSGTIEYIKLVFEAGESYRVDWPEEAEGKHSSVERDIVSIKIDANGVATRRVMSMRNFFNNDET